MQSLLAASLLYFRARKRSLVSLLWYSSRAVRAGASDIRDGREAEAGEESAVGFRLRALQCQMTEGNGGDTQHEQSLDRGL